MSHKVVYNGCFGGFSLSDAGIAKGREISGNPTWGGDQNGRELSRHDPVLVAVVEQLGNAADGDVANLCIEVIEEERYYIWSYDGSEEVVTPATVNWVKIEATA